MKKKVIGILQPVYMPWLGYFEQIAYVDEFIIFDDVQYTKKDWRNRNRIKTAHEAMWITVPVRKAPIESKINQIKISYERDWVKSHLRSIVVNYSACKYFDTIYPDIERLLESRPEYLIELDVCLIKLFCDYLKISTPISYASSVSTDSVETKAQHPCDEASKNEHKNRRILNICKYYNATILYDGKSAADFIDTERFSVEGVEVVFQDYDHPVYQQLFGKFIAYQSILDLIMNAGPEAKSILLSSPYPEKLKEHKNNE